ncbi:hypothetical protein I7I50_01488 [Histoplasma capsulatum G186AR]|uniref:Uncharacterized protein n=1 Tax=Ajellomyces capsulatus TaxID=5037 RepID=A0A8H8CT47_AJECA|nr:hypothetical protein I7I52_12604 [Histoplasma capsulatum]QSS73355.1 hypothetical protein I7I50_01488 [Histoplasma capsulatum G186AR]
MYYLLGHCGKRALSHQRHAGSRGDEPAQTPQHPPPPTDMQLPFWVVAENQACLCSTLPLPTFFLVVSWGTRPLFVPVEGFRVTKHLYCPRPNVSTPCSVCAATGLITC